MLSLLGVSEFGRVALVATVCFRHKGRKDRKGSFPPPCANEDARIGLDEFFVSNLVIGCTMKRRVNFENSTIVQLGDCFARSVRIDLNLLRIGFRRRAEPSLRNADNLKLLGTVLVEE